jgi:hypothetical protein
LNSASAASSQISARSYLAGIGAKLKALDVFQPIREGVSIAQKTVKDSPSDKLYDLLISLLCGASGVVEVDKLVRSDRGLQRAFGRERCAEQSVIQQTLDASSAENVEQMIAAVDKIYRHYSQGYRHDYHEALQILDIDMSGQPCGASAALATKGYFAGQRNRKGRQLGRVLATRYGEIVCERTYAGTAQLPVTLQPLVSAAAQTLEITQAAEKRAQTLIRVDSGGGSRDDINWLLSRGYRILLKDYSTVRARQLAESVQQWFEDPAHPGRQVGLVTAAADYDAPVLRLAVRCRKNNEQWAVGVLITNLTPPQVSALLNRPLDLTADNLAALWLCYAEAYDLRGGGVETAFKQDNQALHIKQRNKKRFEAQQMLTQLNALAHNILVWAKHWLCQGTTSPKPLGLMRFIRDVCTTVGQLFFDRNGRLIEIRLNGADTVVKPWLEGLSLLLKPLLIVVNLDKT